MSTDPHAVGRDSDRAFWADAYADAVEERLDRGEATEPVVIKGGISPSGVPHLGNVNEIMRGNYVADTLRERGYEVRQVFTTDDRDPLRKLPRKLADLDGSIVDLGDDRVDAGALGRNLGRPYTDIEDPFGCCDSYGAHFSNLIAESAQRLGVDIDVVSNTDYYRRGEFDDAIRDVLTDRETARDVLSTYQNKVDGAYVPFNPICESCGKITETVTDVDLANDRVAYRCTDMEAGDRTIEGCDHEGTATIREGKLPWRFEWPAQWRILGVDFEPFGKDHAEGSWPSGEDVARNVLDTRPPVPMVYEWFTLNGDPFSSSAGNVMLVHDVLNLLERDVVRYFFATDPGRARDFSVERLDQLTNEFDALERRYYGEDGAESESAQERVPERAYPLIVAPTTFRTETNRRQRCETSISVSSVIEYELAASVDGRHLEQDVDFDVAGADDAPEAWSVLTDRVPPNVLVREPFTDRQHVDPDALYDARDALVDGVFAERVRIPYSFAAVLGMTDDPALREEIAREEGHVPDGAPKWAVEAALERVERARTWARRTDNEFNYELKRSAIPEVDVDDDTAAALDELATFVAEGHGGEAIQGEIYETAKRHDVDVGDFFAAGYRLFFDDDEGPKLGQFLGKLDREFVVGRLRRER